MPRMQSDGDDIIILRAQSYGDTVIYYEVDRLPIYAWQMDTANSGSYVAFRTKLGTSWQADKPSPNNSYYEVYWGNPATTGSRPRTPDNIYYPDHTGFESESLYTNINGWENWSVNIESCYVMEPPEFTRFSSKRVKIGRAHV